MCGEGPKNKKMAAILAKVYKWHIQNICVRLVKGLHEPYHAGIIECFHEQWDW